MYGELETSLLISLNQIQFLDTIKYFRQSLGNVNTISREREKFIKKDPKLSKKYLSCTEEEKKWILNWIENGKFFLPHHFYFSLKDTTMTNEEYESVKKFYQTMKLENLGQLNKIYNFQDNIILCKIFEQRSSHLQDLFKFNPRKCNSASSFSGCVHGDKSKCCIALSTDAEHVKVFEKMLRGGFSCRNERLAFDTEILLNDDKKNNKVLFDLHIDGKKHFG